VVILYPWPRNLEWQHGSKKPSPSLRRVLERYDAMLSNRADGWVSRWDEAQLKNFYVEYLLYHEIGHHVDWYHRHWSKANRRELEEAANQYAFCKTTRRSICYNAVSREERLKAKQLHNRASDT